MTTVQFFILSMASFVTSKQSAFRFFVIRNPLLTRLQSTNIDQMTLLASLFVHMYVIFYTCSSNDPGGKLAFLYVTIQMCIVVLFIKTLTNSLIILSFFLNLLMVLPSAENLLHGENVNTCVYPNQVNLTRSRLCKKMI